MNWEITRQQKGLIGTLEVPSDKSISHRSIMFGSIAKGEVRIKNFLFSGDCVSTMNAFRSLGIEILEDGETVLVKGKGLGGLKAPSGGLYLGNSGTTMRIISGILAAQAFSCVLTGDKSLSSRPMKRVIEPLTLMGAQIDATEGMYAPLRITGTGGLKAIDYKTPVASAQVKSCILSAGLYAAGITTVTEPFDSRDHTERMLKYFGAHLKKKGLTTTLEGGRELTPKDIEVPGDISSAAFFMVAALIIKDSKITLRNVGINPTRTGLVDVLIRMGAKITVLDQRGELEPVADIVVESSDLIGTTVEEKEVPLLIDEIPVLAVACAVASGKTIIKGIKELKVKETDRVKSLVDNLGPMGAKIKEEGNSLIIDGQGGLLKAGTANSFKDHRIAMCMAIAALASDGECIIKDIGCADTSYPGFLQDLDRIRG